MRPVRITSPDDEDDTVRVVFRLPPCKIKRGAWAEGTCPLFQQGNEAGLFEMVVAG